MRSRSFTFEENASKSLAKTLSSEAGVELAVLNPLESLTDQEMKMAKTTCLL